MCIRYSFTSVRAQAKVVGLNPLAHQLIFLFERFVLSNSEGYPWGDLVWKPACRSAYKVGKQVSRPLILSQH